MTLFARTLRPPYSVLPGTGRVPYPSVVHDPTRSPFFCLPVYSSRHSSLPLSLPLLSSTRPFPPSGSPVPTRPGASPVLPSTFPCRCVSLSLPPPPPRPPLPLGSGVHRSVGGDYWCYSEEREGKDGGNSLIDDLTPCLPPRPTDVTPFSRDTGVWEGFVCEVRRVLRRRTIDPSEPVPPLD